MIDKNVALPKVIKNNSAYFKSFFRDYIVTNITANNSDYNITVINSVIL